MGRTFDRGVLAGIGVLVALLVFSAALTYWNTQQLHHDATLVAHTHEVLDKTSAVLRTLVDAEAGERGFVATGKDEFLQPYTEALVQFNKRLAHLKQLTHDNQRQQARLEEVEEMARARVALLKEGIKLRRAGADGDRLFAVAKKGKLQMDAIRARVQDMEKEEHDLLDARKQQSDSAYQVAVLTGLLTAALGLLALGAFLWLLRRSLAVRQQAAAALHEQREWFRTTLASIGDAVIATDTHGVVTFLNPVAQALTGWSAREAAGQPLERVFRIVNEQTRQPVENPVSQVLREGVTVGLANHTVLIARDGREISIDDSGAPIRSEHGAIAGVVLVFRDVTEIRRAVEARLHLAAIVESSDDAIISKNLDGIIVSWNQGAERMYGYTTEEIVGKPLALLAPPEHPDEMPALMERLKRGERIEHYETVRVRKDGRRVNVSLTISPVKNAEGHIVGASKIARDITASKRSEAALRFLAEASKLLAELRDVPTTLQNVAAVAVPHFADWCAVDMLAPDGALRRVAVAHVDPSKVELARELYHRHPPNPAAPQGVWNIVRTGQAEMVSDITDALLQESVKDEDLLRTLRQLGLKSYIGAPLQARGTTLGVITFIAAESGHRYGPADLRLAEDLAQRAAIAVENARLYSELREADRRKDEFLAMLAHELRNPLAPIRNALHIMKMAGANGAAAEQARQMTERQVQYLVRLVDDLLDVSRIMRGRIELRKEPVELATVVARAVETAQPVLDAQGQQLLVTLPPQPVQLDADPTRLTQAVANLLNNAAKFSPRAGRVWLSAESTGDEVAIRVKDEGAGIPLELLPQVFDLFVQGDNSLERSQGGLGIGLTVVRRLVEMHGGTVTAHSAGPGQGSEFILRLPILREACQGQVPGPHEPPPAPTPPRRILVVDDNVDAAESVAMVLRLWGHQVRIAHTGPEALQAAEEDEPEVVVLDIGLPGMSGYEVARRLRAQPRFRTTTLAAVTGYGQDEDRRRSQEAGFDAHLVKPVDPEILAGLLARGAG